LTYYGNAIQLFSEVFFIAVITAEEASMHKVRTGLGEVINVWSPDDAKREGLTNWSLRPLQAPEDVRKHPVLSGALYSALRELEVKRAYAPNVAAMSGLVVAKELLEIRINLGDCTYLYRNCEIPADGIFLNHTDEAFVMSAAGCPVIIATAGSDMIVAHAGRDSLIDRGAVIGNPSRAHVSVVGFVLDAFRRRGHPASHVSMCLQFAIPADLFEHRFDHPKHWQYNQDLVFFVNRNWPGCTIETGNGVCLDLEAVFTDQARGVGVRHVWTARSLAEYPDLAHTRDGKDPSRRNLFIVKREY
jgi:hypothetical protein